MIEPAQLQELRPVERARSAAAIKAGVKAGDGGIDAMPGVVGMPLAPGDLLDLEDAMAMLPPGAKRVFVLHDVEGYKHEEIAEMLGVTSGATKAQLHRARLLLREALNR